MSETQTLLLETMDERDLRPRTRLGAYCVVFVAIQVGALILTLLVAATPWFISHRDLSLMGYSLRLKNQSCDVLIYGDSSALTGLDPRVIQQISGLKTCNISEGTTIQSVVGSNFALDAYLRNNKRPRFLLEMFTPAIYRPYRRPFEEYHIEGMVYGLRYDHSPRFYWGLLRHPKWVAKFAIWAGHAMLQDFFASPFRASSPRFPLDMQKLLRDNQHGLWQFPLPAQKTCTRIAFNPTLIPRDPDGLSEVRRRYGAAGTQVIFNVSPVPFCDLMYDAYRQRTEGLHDNAFERLPISYFNQGDVHFSPEGSRYISIEAGNQILQLEREAANHLNPADKNQRHRG